jgi:hypothetical protein
MRSSYWLDYARSNEFADDRFRDPDVATDADESDTSLCDKTARKAFGRA